MNYNLNDITTKQEKSSNLKILQKLLQLIREERRNLLLACLAILTNSGLTLLSPYIIGHTIDIYVMHKDYSRRAEECRIAGEHCTGCFRCRLYADADDGQYQPAYVV